MQQIAVTFCGTEDDGSDDDKDDHHNQQARPPGDFATMKWFQLQPSLASLAFQLEEVASAEPQSVG